MAAGEADNVVVQCPVGEASVPVPVVAQAAPEIDTKPKRKPARIEPTSVGAKTLFVWVDWLQRNGVELPTHVASFKKDATRVFVYAYQCAAKATCVLLKLQDDLPKTVLIPGMDVVKGESRIRDFREWERDFNSVKARFLAEGWSEVMSMCFSSDATAMQSEGGSNAQPTLI